MSILENFNWEKIQKLPVADRLEVLEQDDGIRTPPQVIRDFSLGFVNTIRDAIHFVITTPLNNLRKISRLRSR